MALNNVTVTGNLGAAGFGGTAVFTPGSWLTDPADSLMIPPATVSSGPLPSTGRFTVSLLATDNTAPLPAGWVWNAVLAPASGAPYSFSFKVYAGPFAFTATNASPCVFTAVPGTGQPWAAGMTVTLSGSLPGGFSAATTYYVVNPSGNTFSLAATSGGAAINSTSTGSGNATVTQVDISDLAPVVPVSATVAYLPLSGGTMTGPVTLAADPASALQPATKQYVDALLGRKAATAAAGFALQNATPTIISWAVPADGRQHPVMIFVSIDVTVAQTGGGVLANATAPDGSNSNFVFLPGSLGAGFRTDFGNTVGLFVVGANTTVTVQQSSAQTAGAALVWAEIWGA